VLAVGCDERMQPPPGESLSCPELACPYRQIPAAEEAAADLAGPGGGQEEAFDQGADEYWYDARTETYHDYRFEDVATAPASPTEEAVGGATTEEPYEVESSWEESGEDRYAEYDAYFWDEDSPAAAAEAEVEAETPAEEDYSYRPYSDWAEYWALGEDAENAWSTDKLASSAAPADPIETASVDHRAADRWAKRTARSITVEYWYSDDGAETTAALTAEADRQAILGLARALDAAGSALQQWSRRLAAIAAPEVAEKPAMSSRR
jgi:hypothetical protein